MSSFSSQAPVFVRFYETNCPTYILSINVVMLAAATKFSISTPVSNETKHNVSMKFLSNEVKKRMKIIRDHTNKGMQSLILI